MIVKDIYSFLNERFPVETAMPFDNAGFLIGNSFDSVTKVLVTLDCSLEAVDYAIENECDLIISHHPVIFEPLKSVTENSVAYKCISNGISVISMHTNLDLGEGGVNDELCKALGLKDIEKIEDDEGFILRKGTLSPISSDNLAIHIKKCLGGAVKYNVTDKPISDILVCSGSGGSYIYLAKQLGFDALITADVKHNIFIDAQNMDISVFDAGHFDTEDIIVEPLCKMLSKQFPELTFLTHHSEKIKSI